MSNKEAFMPYPITNENSNIRKCCPDEQVNKMACDMCTIIKSCNDPYNPIKSCAAYTCAKIAYEKGYRKSADVAREIFEEIEEKGKVDEPIVEYYILSYFELAELKKKYTEGGKDDGKV